MAELNATRIGYLRMAPRNGEPGAAAPTPACKAMWRKLSNAGYMTREADARNSLGDKAIEDFDRGLSEDCRAVINAVKAQESRVAVMNGILTVLSAGLASFNDETHSYELTADGLKIADPVGEEGYFTKSGNLVKVLRVSSEPGYRGQLDVVRLDGESAGKQMLIPRGAFVLKADWVARNG